MGVSFITPVPSQAMHSHPSSPAATYPRHPPQPPHLISSHLIILPISSSSPPQLFIQLTEAPLHYPSSYYLSSISRPAGSTSRRRGRRIHLRLGCRRGLRRRHYSRHVRIRCPCVRVVKGGGLNRSSGCARCVDVDVEMGTGNAGLKGWWQWRWQQHRR